MIETYLVISSVFKLLTLVVGLCLSVWFLLKGFAKKEPTLRSRALKCFLCTVVIVVGWTAIDFLWLSLYE